MADASIVQASFLGGEWSPWCQGRIDDPVYKTALNVCLNALPLQEGAWARRGGWIEQGVTLHNRANGRIVLFMLPNNQPAYMEMTYDTGASFLTFWISNGTQGFKRLTETAVNITAISTANPAVLQTSTATAWSTGDWVVFNLNRVGDNASATGNLGNNKAIQITKIDTTHFSLYEDVAGHNLNGTTLAYIHVSGDTVARVLQLSLPYTTLADLRSVRVVQADYLALLLARGYAPKAVNYNSSTFAIADAGSKTWDGPYLDPFPGLSQQGTSLGLIGTAWGSLSPTSTTTFECTDSQYTFTSADIGKCLRMYWQPPAWDMTVDYTSANPTQYTAVSYNGASWNLGNEFQMPAGTQPGSSYVYNDHGHQIVFVPWNPVPNGAGFTTAYITSIVSGSKVNITLTSLFPPIASMRGTPSLVIDLWQLGLYGPAQYPSCGCYHEGRLWLAGAVQNRFDASVSDALDILKVGRANGVVPSDAFSPTDVYGNVGDANGIAAILNDKEVNWIYWIEPGASGMVAGTPGGEFLITASNLNDPLTPTTTQAHKVTKYKVANAEPRFVGGALIFIQAFGRRVMEYFADAFTSKFLARHLNEKAGHLAQVGLSEIAYQEERTPVLWARRTDGGVIGCTYRRFSNFSNQPAEFMAWHRHIHGLGRSCESICTGPGPSGVIDNVMALMHDPLTNIHTVEMMAPVFEESYLLPQAAHIDGLVGFVANETGSGPLPPACSATSPDLWSPTYFNSTWIDITNGGLDATVSASGVNNEVVEIGTRCNTTGRQYFEIVYVTGASGYDMSWGIAAATHGNTLQLGNTEVPAAAIGYNSYSAAKAWRYNGITGTTVGLGTPSAGQSMGIVVDLTAGWICIANVSAAPTVWYGITNTANPATGTNAYPFTPFGVAMYIAWASNQNGAQPSLRINASGPFVIGTPPAGSTAWDP